MAPRFDERAFHRWLAAHLPAGRGRSRDLLDDVAAVPVPPGRVAYLTTDALAEGTHFLARSRPYSVGQAVAAVSLSDLASKGARPAAFLLDLLLPPETAATWAQNVVRGAEAMSARFDAHLVGGDTKASASRSVVGTFLGFRRRGRIPRRDGARPGDAVVVTGTVGRGGVASRALAAPEPSAAALDGLLAVEPRVDEGDALAPLVRAMTDTSDGVGEAARLLAAASDVRLELDGSALPWAPGVASPSATFARRWAIASYGGDYELCATLPRSKVAAARAAVGGDGPGLTVIGRVTDGRGAWIVPPGDVPVPIRAAGWDPFRPAPP